MEPRSDLIELQRTFVPPAGLARARPRETRLTSNGIALVVAAVAIFAGGLVASGILLREASRQADARKDLAQHGVDTVAEVTRLWRSTGDSHQPWAAYRWTDGSRSIGGEIKVRLATWNTLHVGSPLAIRYDPSNPSVSVLSGTEPRGIPLWLAPLTGAVMAAGGVILLVVLRRQRQLLTDGRAAPAIVRTRKRVSTQHGGSYLSIGYEFPTLSGGTASGSTYSSRNPPAVGGVLCVIYDPDRPRRSMAYPLKLVKLAD